MDIAKINFAMTYLTGVAQDWFEMGLNQEDQGILQDWLSDWNLTGTYLWTSYIDILVSWTPLVKRPTCWIISA